jgi:hypothetical protein
MELLQAAVGTNQVRAEPSTAHVPNGLLGGLGLLFASNYRYERDMNLREVVLASPAPQLPHCLNERPTFNVANRTTQLDDADIRRLLGVIDRVPCNALYPVLDGVCQVRHYLNCTTKVVASPLSLNHMQVYLPRGNVVVPRQRDVEKALVVAQVQVNFAAIIKHKHLAMSFSLQVVR